MVWWSLDTLQYLTSSTSLLCRDLLNEFRKEELFCPCNVSSVHFLQCLFICSSKPPTDCVLCTKQWVVGCLWSGNQEKEWKSHFYLRVIQNGSQEECRNACLSTLSQCTLPNSAHHHHLAISPPSLSVLGIEPRVLQCSSTDQHPGLLWTLEYIIFDGSVNQ